MTWPVALDNDYGTWNAYSNEYWPAEYLIDRSGQIRHVHFGEGDYGGSEEEIRSLLAEGAKPLPARPTSVADRTPSGDVTPESYLGYARLQRYSGSQIVPNRSGLVPLPVRALPGRARLRRGLDGRAAGDHRRGSARACACISRRGTSTSCSAAAAAWRASSTGVRTGTVDVTGYRLYTIRGEDAVSNGILELRFDPGVRAYAFTFG